MSGPLYAQPRCSAALRVVLKPLRLSTSPSVHFSSLQPPHQAREQVASLTDLFLLLRASPTPGLPILLQGSAPFSACRTVPLLGCHSFSSCRLSPIGPFSGKSSGRGKVHRPLEQSQTESRSFMSAHQPLFEASPDPAASPVPALRPPGWVHSAE